MDRPAAILTPVPVTEKKTPSQLQEVLGKKKPKTTKQRRMKYRRIDSRRVLTLNNHMSLRSESAVRPALARRQTDFVGSDQKKRRSPVWDHQSCLVGSERDYPKDDNSLPQVDSFTNSRRNAGGKIEEEKRTQLTLRPRRGNRPHVDLERDGQLVSDHGKV